MTTYTSGDTVISSGVMASGDVFLSNASQTVLAGGVAESTVLSGGDQYVYGLASATAVIGGFLEVESGGLVSNVSVNSTADARGVLNVYGLAESSWIGTGASIDTEGHGVILSSLVWGGEYVHRFGSALGGIIESGGRETVYSGGFASGTTVEDGGAELISAGAQLTNVVVSSGGLFGISTVVSSGAIVTAAPVAISSATSVSGAVLESGALEAIEGATILNGGTLVVGAGETLLGAFFVSSGGTLSGTGTIKYAVSNYGLVSDITLIAGQIDTFGVDQSVTIGAESFGMVEAGGISIGAVILSGGSQYLSDGAVSSKLTLSADGEVEFDGSQTTVTGLALRSGALVDLDQASVSVAANALGQLLVTSNGAVIEAIGLAGFASDLRFHTQVQGAGTRITVTSATSDAFGGGAASDILLQNASGALVTGEVGSGRSFGYALVGALGSDWSFEGNGYFLADASADFLIRDASGALVAGEVVGGQAQYTLIGALGSEWSFRGTGDFLGHGQSDFLIEDTAGALVVGEVGSNGQAGYTTVGALGSDWSFRGAGDFLGDGLADALIQNADGLLVVGEVVGGLMQYTTIGALGADWTFEGTGDFLGDGSDQFLMRDGSGAVVLGQVAGGQAQYTLIGALGSDWNFVGTGHYTGGAADFLVENASTGALVAGAVSGGQAQYSLVGGLGSGWTFHG